MESQSRFGSVFGPDADTQTWSRPSFAAIAERVENTNVSFMGRMFLVQSGSGPMQARHGVGRRCLRRTIPFLSDSIVVV